MAHDDHMTMATATPTASSATPSSSSTGMSHADMGMGMGMDMGSGSSPSSSPSSSGHTMSSADMAMVFFRSATTPLYAYGWTPAGRASYAATCVFLVALALAHRLLVALRFALFDSNPALHTHRHQKLEEDEPAVAPGSGSAIRRIRSQWSSHPFRVATETSRAALEVVISGVGYLLMLAVMTMNVGYFLSVLGGVFLGAFVAGRFQANDNHH